MLQSPDRLADFAAAILNPAASVPAGLVGPDGHSSPRRFAVYRNNVVVGLVEALKANFPAVTRIVGEEFFRAMARDYVLREPPSSPLLLEYGSSFPVFIDAFEPAEGLPYLGDVARIERAWTAAYHAPDAEPLDATDFAKIPADRLSDLRLMIHPSVEVVRSQFPALTIWRMNIADGVPEPIDLDSGGEDCLIVRPDAEIGVHRMAEGGTQFVAALARGSTLTKAAKAGWAASGAFDLADNIAALIAAGAFVGYSDPDEKYLSEALSIQAGAELS